MTGLPAMPLARTVTMSFVLMQPSTEIQLKESSFASFNACFNIFPVMAASVVMNPSMVAIFGAIIPEPLAQPPMITGFPPTVSRTVRSLITKSVVRIPWANALPPAGDNAAVSSGRAAVILSMGNGFPIIPVEATRTSVALIPNAVAHVSAMRTASA